MRKLANIALVLLTLLVCATYLPDLYDAVFHDDVEKTHLFYSPVLKRFIYTEKITGELPPEALALAEDHHAAIAYRDQDGAWYSRKEFEKLLPFIYYKNMDVWGLLPLHINGQVLDKDTIRKNRQVLELKASTVKKQQTEVPLWPLIESDPGQKLLVFPEDRFRMTKDAMEFVNADYNRVDKELTARFTQALQDKGFVFPARSVHGKFTVLKSFDEGVFIVDAASHVFHVKRHRGAPVVVKTPIPAELHTRYMKISENKRKEYYGLLLSGNNGIYLISYDNYNLIQIPVEHYDPDTMDFKLLINPLYRTAVYSDDTTIRALAMDTAYTPLSRYEHHMSRAEISAADVLHNALFPFAMHLVQKDGGYLDTTFESGGKLALFGMAGSLILLLLYRGFVDRRAPKTVELLLVALTGIYGLISLNVIEFDS